LSFGFWFKKQDLNKLPEEKPMLKVGIIGGSGLTGRELIKILLKHHDVQLAFVTSRASAGQKISSIFPEFLGLTSLSFIDPSEAQIFAEADFFFVCLPHTAAMDFVKKARDKGKPVVDLSADYRMKDVKTYAKFYKTEHKYPALLKQAVYGLPELFRNKIKGAQLVANSGCHAACTILGAAPALKHLPAESIISDSKTGVSGAGIKAVASSMYININENVTPYNTGFKHRHAPEIVEVLKNATGKKTKLVLTPQLTAVDRGMLATIYIKLKKGVTVEKAQKIYTDFYKNEFFVRFPETISMHNSQNTNFVDIKVEDSGQKDILLVVVSFDNLGKGASGNAVQNMNIMMGFEESAGLI
jgi:N-acetyl-gamma-glutamyl-phosphate reductase